MFKNRHFNIRVKIKIYTIVILIDLRALSNFILSYIIIRLYIKTELREEPYSLSIIDRKPINIANKLIYIKTKEFIIIYYITKH